MCRKLDSFVSFYLIAFGRNLLFGRIGHFGLLKDVNISFLLSKTASSTCRGLI